MSHTTVHIEIHRVVNATVPGTGNGCRCMNKPSCGHAQPQTNRSDVEVVNLTARVDGVDDKALEAAIVKATKHLDCERPPADPLINIAERLGYPND